MEEDVFDDYSGSLTGEVKTNGGLAFPFQTADMMLKGGKMRSRAGSLSSPTHLPPPRLGVSGLYTDHLERRKYKLDPPGLEPPVRIKLTKGGNTARVTIIDLQAYSAINVAELFIWKCQALSS